MPLDFGDDFPGQLNRSAFLPVQRRQALAGEFAVHGAGHFRVHYTDQAPSH